MVVSSLRRHLAAAIVLLGFGGANAQPDFQSYRPSASATRITSDEAPTIDGNISDSVWAKAKPIRCFYQLEPDEGAPADEKTIVRVLYDGDNLYFAIKADDPAGVTARIKQRDGDIDADDFVRIYLDPDMSRRNGYIFEVNPLGARREGLVQNNNDFIYQWNTLWSAKTAITAKGWTAEVAIPFRSISYGSRSVWGFDLFRLVRKKYERMRWSSINNAIPSSDIAREGSLSSIKDIRRGLGLDVQAYALTRYTENWDTPHDGTGLSFRPSGTLYYRVTPSLTGTLTTNTDFSEAPLDRRQVNTSRFDLFYPERRDFFLQDAAAFEFGGGALDDPNGAPFFTRRIGIVGDQAVNILGGAKLSGDYDGVGIGALSVRTTRGGGAEEQQLSVARVSVPVSPQARLGVVATDGDPNGKSQNNVIGADFQFRDSKLIEGNILKADLYYERSFSSLKGQGDSFGLAVDYPNEPWDHFFAFKQVGAGFDPALGFVSDTAIREYRGHFRHRDRFENRLARSFDVEFNYDVTTQLDNTVQSRYLAAKTAAQSNAGDYISFEIQDGYENTPTFRLPRDIPVPAGRYEFSVYHLYAETAAGRAVSAAFDVRCCGYFGGRQLRTETTVNVRPNDTLMLEARHAMKQIDMNGQHLDIHIESIDMSVNFTPDMELRGQLEYDNISKEMALSLRYRWELEPGTELLIVAGDDATVRETYYQSHQSQLSVRLGKTFRL